MELVETPVFVMVSPLMTTRREREERSDDQKSGKAAGRANYEQQRGQSSSAVDAMFCKGVVTGVKERGVVEMDGRDRERPTPHDRAPL